jgi:hypothetical protein
MARGLEASPLWVVFEAFQALVNDAAVKEQLK